MITKVSGITFPALVVAPDGWVAYLPTAARLARWNSRGLRKYTRLGFVILDSQGGAWRLDSIRWLESLSRFHRLCAHVTGWALPAELWLARVGESGFELTKEMLRQAIRSDDDLLTQFSSKRQINLAIDQAADTQALFDALLKLRVVE